MRGGDKLYVPVENIELLSPLRQRERGRHPRQPGRRSLAAAQVADEGADPRDCGRADQDRGDARDARRRRSPSRTPAYPQFVDRFPYEETDDQDRAIEDVLEDLEAGKPMDRLVCGDVGFGKTEVALRAAFVTAMAGQAGRAGLPDHPARAPALQEFRRAAPRLPDRGRAAVAAGAGGRSEEDQGRRRRRHGRHRHRHPCAAREEHRVQAAWAWSSSTRSSISESPTRSG